MIRRLRAQSLTRQVQLIIVAASVAALLAASLFILIGQAIQARADLNTRVETLADVIGKNSLGALTFEDAAQADRVLRSLSAQQNIELALIFTADGSQIAELRVPGITEAPLEWITAAGAAARSRTLGMDYLELVQPIFFDDDVIGTIFIRSTQQPVFDSLYRTGMWTAIAIFLGAGIAYALASLLAPAIVQPIQTLSKLAGSVRADEDFSLRANVDGNDEITALARAVNDMLSKLEARDARLEAHRDQLQSEVDARTRSLAEANERLELFVSELKEARDKAEAASVAKSEFLARMSHEIRTPMNGVLGMTELMIGSSDLDAMSRRYAENIHYSADSLLGIINDILDFSKVEAGRLELEQEPFDLRDLVEDVGELLAEQAVAKNLDLVCDIPTDLIAARIGDSLRIRQVLVNLIGNAIKFTAEGEVVVRLQVADPSSPDIHILIEDTGIGIESANLSRIFDSFSQEDGSVTRRFGGTGLGLAISKQLVELMGGQINVTSEVGRGTTFSANIPLTIDSSQQQVDAKPLSLGPMRVLLVDDSATYRSVLGRQLAAWQVDVTPVADVRSAQREIDTRAFDYVIVDTHMSGQDGIKLSGPLRAGEAEKGAKLVVMHYLSTPISATDVESNDINALLTKPVRQKDLFTCLENLAAGVSGSPFEITGSMRTGESTPEPIDARILIVEDNKVNHLVASAMLTKLGCESVSVNNGEEALDVLLDQGEVFDAVLMDCQMPVMDGFTATRKIREHEAANQRPALPIIALTANAMSGDRERCIEAGMSGYLSKPFTMPQLNDVLLAEIVGNRMIGAVAAKSA